MTSCCPGLSCGASANNPRVAGAALSHLQPPQPVPLGPRREGCPWDPDTWKGSEWPNCWTGFSDTNRPSSREIRCGVTCCVRATSDIKGRRRVFTNLSWGPERLRQMLGWPGTWVQIGVYVLMRNAEGLSSYGTWPWLGSKDWRQPM